MRTAVDIALIPSTADIETILELSAMLRVVVDGEIRLAHEPGPGEGFPHLSLFMGVLDARDLETARRALVEIAAEQRPVETGVDGIETHARSAGGRTTLMMTTRTVELVALHERVGKTFDEFLTRDARIDDLVDPEDGDAENSVAWINDYAEEAAGSEFDPHVTLGRGGPLFVEPPPLLLFDRIGIYALGPGCTCREELFGVDLT